MLESLLPIDWVLLAVFAVVACIQLLYMWFILGKFSFHKPKPYIITHTEPVSVIIAARNEYENLQKNLRLILEQDYPNFEVVVVNDCSWDESQKLLEEMQLQYKHLKVSQLIEQEKYPTGKKFAITIGIKAASNDLLIFTDADCQPASNQWLRLMAEQFTPGKEIVLGFSPYNKYSGLLNLYIRFETLTTALFYFSFAILKNAYMGVGRNMAYRKQLFFKHKGFASHKHILSGDDDLFVNETATPSNVAIQYHTDSFVYTEPKRSFEKYGRQKTRHMTTGKHYKNKHKRSLGLYYSSLFFFYALLVASLVINVLTWPIVASIFGLRLISQFIVYYMAAKKLKCTSVVWALPVLDVLFLFYMLYFGTRGYFTRNNNQW